MIISALARYYDCLVEMEDSPLIPKGRSRVKTGYLVAINQDGKIQNIYPHTRKDISSGKERAVAVEELFPKRLETTTVMANLVEHRPKYIFGLETDKGRFVETNKSKKSFADCKAKNIEFLVEIDSELSTAMAKFYENWAPSEETENEHLAQIVKDFDSSYYTFCLETNIEELINKDKKILDKFDSLEEPKKDEIVAQCSVCGEQLAIARMHDNLKGIFGANATGANIVSCKNSSSFSYGKEQSYISCVSEKVMKKYTEAFNTLASSRQNKGTMGGMTLLFWAETKTRANDYADVVNLFSGLMYTDKTTEYSSCLKTCIAYMAQGKLPNAKSLELDENVEFYILGLTPNSARLSIKLFIHNSFGNIMKNIQDHYDNIKVKEDQRIPGVYQILKELASPKGDGKINNSGLSAGILNSIITGAMYPQELLAQAITRVKTDQDEDKNNFIKINDVRLGIVKMCINRKIKKSNKGELITMALNEETKGQSYLCGRLFAVLEKIQREAVGDINAGIKARYFGSACSTPAMIFPILLKLSQNHINKMDNARYLESKISEILADISSDGFPKTLSIEEQGIFIIGYYQQNKSLYTKKENN